MRLIPITTALIASLAATVASAGDLTLTLKNHQFSPQTLEIPADTKVKLTVINQDPTPAEFESHDLKREKVVDGNSQVIVYLGPVSAGTYSFCDDFRCDTVKGTVVVK